MSSEGHFKDRAVLPALSHGGRQPSPRIPHSETVLWLFTGSQAIILPCTCSLLHSFMLCPFTININIFAASSIFLTLLTHTPGRPCRIRRGYTLHKGAEGADSQPALSSLSQTAWWWAVSTREREDFSSCTQKHHPFPKPCTPGAASAQRTRHLLICMD